MNLLDALLNEVLWSAAAQARYQVMGEFYYFRNTGPIQFNITFALPVHIQIKFNAIIGRLVDVYI
jgi:hypothetical protein